MLPIVVYHVGNEEYELLMELLEEEARQARISVSLQLRTDEVREAVGAVREEDHIFLLISGVNTLSEDAGKMGLKLGRMVMSRNRDNYVVFITGSRKTVEDVLCLCMRPAGVMATPLDRKRITATFRQIVHDFEQLQSRGDDSEGECLVLKVGGTMHRLSLREILYVQAMDKKIEIFTDRQSVQAYKSITEIADLLGDRFVKCHRSCIVNVGRIQAVDVPNMTVILRDGTELPLSRSCKDAVCAAVQGQEEAGG